MRLRRQRDRQQWLLDYLVKTTGRVQHFDSDRRIVPSQAKSYTMIPKVLGKQGLHEEAIARAADAAGHHHAALLAYCKAMASYIDARVPNMEANEANAAISQPAIVTASMGRRRGVCIDDSEC